MAAPSLDDYLRSAERTVIHLEMRDGYMSDDPRFRAWQTGHRNDPTDRDSWWHPWLALMEQTVRRGVVARRARIVSEPVSEYIRYEYDMTFANIAVGEQVRWLPRRHATDIALPGNDFWLIDDSVLLINHFSGEGDFVGEERVDNLTVVALCRTAFEAVWVRAIPHIDYLPT